MAELLLGDDEWPLAPGGRISRARLHDLVGGGRQSGISPSRKTPNILLFYAPDSGEKHGYFDHWKHDGLFHYTGEGQNRDQVFARGNKAIRDHALEKRALRLFKGAGGDVEYVGEFSLDHFYASKTNESGSSKARNVIIFAIRPSHVDPVGFLADTEDSSSENDDQRIRRGSIEKPDVTESLRPQIDQVRFVRSESLLVQRFSLLLEANGFQPTRLRIKPTGEQQDIINDLYVEQLGLIVEAKSDCHRGSARMAIGQLLDYARFVDRAVRCALLPSRPGADLASLFASASVIVVWEDDNGFLSQYGALESSGDFLRLASLGPGVCN